MAQPARCGKQIWVGQSASKRAMRIMRVMGKIKFYRLQLHENVFCLLPYGYVRLLVYLQNYAFLVDFHHFQNDFLKSLGLGFRDYWDRLKWDRSRSVLRSHEDLFTLTPYGKTNYSYLGRTKQFVYPLASDEMGYVTCVAPLGSFLGVSWLVTGITKLWLNELRRRSSGAVISKW